MRNFIEVLELTLTLVHPERKSIGYQLNQKNRHKTHLDMITYDPDKKEFTSETEVSFEAVDVSQLKQVTISHKVIISAMDYKMTK